MYLATYQAIAKDERRPGLYREYPRDFFDLVVVDECHRGSVRDESNWREILEYFEPAFQLGMSATPFRQDNGDTYGYFGNPLYVKHNASRLEQFFSGKRSGKIRGLCTNGDSGYAEAIEAYLEHQN